MTVNEVFVRSEFQTGTTNDLHNDSDCLERGIMVFINLTAILQFLLTGILAFMLLCVGQVYAALFAPLGALVVGDLLMRWLAAGECDQPVSNPEAGGQFGPIPVWCAALAWIALFGFYCLQPQS